MKVSSVLVGREVYPLLQAGKFIPKVFILEMKVYPLFQAGKSLSSKVFYFRDESILCSCSREVYPLLQAGKSLSSKVFILEMKVYSVLSGREDFGHYVLK